MVGVVRFERTTSAPQTRRATGLRYTPLLLVLATGIEPVFAAPITIKSLEGFLGYASITFYTSGSYADWPIAS